MARPGGSLTKINTKSIWLHNVYNKLLCLKFFLITNFLFKLANFFYIVVLKDIHNYVWKMHLIVIEVFKNAHFRRVLKIWYYKLRYKYKGDVPFDNRLNIFSLYFSCPMSTGRKGGRSIPQTIRYSFISQILSVLTYVIQFFNGFAIKKPI